MKGGKKAIRTIELKAMLKLLIKEYGFKRVKEVLESLKDSKANLYFELETDVELE